MKKSRAKSAAHHRNRPSLKLPLPWLAISVLTIILVLVTSDFLPRPENKSPVVSVNSKKTGPKELPANTSPLRFTLQKIEVLPEEGDTLWSLAEEFYGDGAKWTQLAAENNLRNGRVTTGKALTISGEGIDRKVIFPEKLYRLSAAEPLPASVLLPGLGSVLIPAENSEVLTTTDGRPSLTVSKNSKLKETYEAPIKLAFTKHFIADLNGQQYAAYLYPDPADPAATDLAFFNLTSGH